MACKLCNDTGDQRYWEGRWRDEKAESERLRAEVRQLGEMANCCTYDTLKEVCGYCRCPRSQMASIADG